jgi:hypothetical protein
VVCVQVRFQKTADLPAAFYADWLKIAAERGQGDTSHPSPYVRPLLIIVDLLAHCVKSWGVLGAAGVDVLAAG